MKSREEDTMWVRSQDRKQLVKCTSFSLARNWGGKKKSAIVGSVLNASWWGKDVVLGLYDTKEIALDELTRLQTELVNNSYIYEMN
ncbi:hypothetical protein ACFSRY_19205 [Pontibacter locisalis]|uniref:Uncharacterized protein n=1 Tax=Pontibacter locisalis TaxID=1719035 RepID=A0ABW5IRH3_9BACT